MSSLRYNLPLTALAICLGATTADAATLRNVTTLHASVVRLSDLFDDAGAGADRVLGPGPGAGGRIVVEAAQLAPLRATTDWRPASSGDRAVLDRPGRPLRREDALDAVKSALISAGAWPNAISNCRAHAASRALEAD
jgi:flagella basal body P-ring formation protein FlgA